MVNARYAALQVLERCRKDGAWVSAVLDSVIRKNELSHRDAALVSALCLGVLQNSSYFDFLISAYSSTRADKLEKKVLDILRLGVCQLLLMDRIPQRAAVNETVALCDLARMSRAKALVNAVLRRVAEHLTDLPEVPEKGSTAYLATRYSHPLWLSERLCAEQGYEFTEAFFNANNHTPPLTIQINTQRVSEQEYLCALDNKGIRYTCPPWPAHCVAIEGCPVTLLPGYDEGLFYVQDRAARMAVDLMGLREGMRVLDACASPGGKSFAAALNMNGKGKILSCDIHEKKLSLIQSGARRLGIDCIQTRCRDARHADDSEKNAYDAVIADVPCSGLGVMAKKPEIRGKKAEELRSLPVIQRQILDALSSCVKPGGILLYSTCTILPDENEGVVRSFLDNHPDFHLCAFSIGEKSVPAGYYTFYPNVDGTDGFFAAKLIKDIS